MSKILFKNQIACCDAGSFAGLVRGCGLRPDGSAPNAILAADSAARSPRRNRRNRKQRKASRESKGRPAPSLGRARQGALRPRDGRHEERSITPRGGSHCQTLINTYPDSEYLAKAKLGVADSYYKEGGTSNIDSGHPGIQGLHHVFPVSRRSRLRADAGGMAHYRMMEKADRDKSQAESAEDEFQRFC